MPYTSHRPSGEIGVRWAVSCSHRRYSSGRNDRGCWAISVELSVTMIRVSPSLMALVVMVRILQIAGPPDVDQSGFGRQGDVLPAIHGQLDVDQRRGWKLDRFAGELLDEILEPRVMPDDHDRAGGPG